MISYKCSLTNKPLQSNSTSGDLVYIFLLKQGQVIEYMYGNYDGYNSVIKSTNDDGVTSSFTWKTNLSDMNNLRFHKDESNGIAVILASYWKEGDIFPSKRSDYSLEDDVDSSFTWQQPEEPFHKEIKYNREIVRIS